MKRILPRLILSLVSLAAVWLALEVAARRARGVPLKYFANFVETHVNLMKSVFPTQYDAQLGWIPKPGDYSRDNYWGTSLRILERGVRSNGTNAVAENAPVALAVGDSFTFGSQVGDEETWPAVLERLSGLRVVNAGVFAYGLDQAVLRAEQLADIVKPDLLIVSFIPDNVNRTERAVRTGVPKPYFDIVDGRLELRNTPVPPPVAQASRIGALRRIFGYSYLVDAVMRRLGKDEAWYLGDWESVKAHSRGYDVGCLLMERLAALGHRRAMPVVVLAQYPEELYEVRLPETQIVIDCARKQHLPVADLYEPLREMVRADHARFLSLFHGHMTAAGNRFVAAELLRFLDSEGLVPSSRRAR
jgi:hypothetical protein